MYLYRFKAMTFDEMIISAESQKKAIEIFEGETGERHRMPSRMWGDIEFALEPGTKLNMIVRIKSDDGYTHAIADADEWAAHWPNQEIEFAQWWGEQ